MREHLAARRCQGWAAQIGALQSRRRGDLDAAHVLARAAQGELWAGPVPGEPAVLREHAASSHYWRWLEDAPGYWAKVSPDAAFDGRPLDVPALFTGGWFDIMLDGTLSAFAAFGDRARLVVGPWAHIPWGPRSVGTAGDALSVDRLQLAFFDHVLKGRDDPGPAVRLFDMGSRCWLGQGALEAAPPTRWHLASAGLAATHHQRRTAGPEPEEGDVDLLVHDPWRPAPAVGGHLGRPPAFRTGPPSTSGAMSRSTPPSPWRGPLFLLGPVTAELCVACDRPTHDLDCSLSLVTADGAARVLATGHLRVRAGAPPEPRRVPMRFICCTAPVGAAIRLSVPAAAWPAFAVNPGTGERPETAHAARAEVTTIAIRHGSSQPSTLSLPIVH
jgi:putative CocE/NonD family hydrolase